MVNGTHATAQTYQSKCNVQIRTTNSNYKKKDSTKML